MLARTRLPKTLLWVTQLLFIYVGLFTAMRVLLLLLFGPQGERIGDLLPSFFLGLRYDLRWISALLLPIVLLSLMPRLSPFYAARNSRAWTWYLAFATLFVVFFFAADFGCFAYNNTRLNASALNFAEDPGISARMLWQSYPILWMVAGLALVVLLLRWVFRRTHSYVDVRTAAKEAPDRRRFVLCFALLLGFWAWGGVTGPLRWKDAFGLQDSFRAYLALNPLQNFFTTLRFRKPQASETEARRYAADLRGWMGLPGDGVDYRRTVTPAAPSQRPNVVLVLCESFSMYKSSMSGNPLGTTPYFDSLARGGVFFDRCFSPHFSTARGLFATLTGIPDVQLSKFSTRNEAALDQHIIFNDFEGYKKLYFLGGDPGFNNFSGILRNIQGLQMHTENQFAQTPVDVWGISDKDLFLNAAATLSRQEGPFVALIQTADNHRPFTIPEKERAFRPRAVHPDTLKKYGFESLAEYNAFRYADHNIGTFMEAARRQPWFANTIFVFVGDHGVSGNAQEIYGDVWTRERLTDEHVPLLFYAPAILQAQRRHEVVSQIDVLPSIAGIAGIRYTNSTLGRDVVKGNERHYAFTIQHDEGRIGIITDDFYYSRNLNFNREELHFLPGSRIYTVRQQDSIRRSMAPVTQGMYETARWMLLNNKKTYVKH
ncbi:alkaline phosphatase family protein [Flaviaesturariibacter flavus]|uniref:Alkaline phosphatase family protein n=1 Tax=Flaviaesturariibacter flavus TaxID=2502780 RepID=A0A4R1B3R3_9BACT|nr:alkaline phosphatase family protein [Flaviaesturariibacter flavus]TCJ12501.1 alkaline phosphatase family protein [Flaviaesturariibacter flavus]